MTDLYDVLDDLRRFVGPMYEGKDTMHDLSHIDRLTRCALRLSAGTDAKLAVLQAAALLHGVVYAVEPQLRSFLQSEGVSAPVTDEVVRVAWESQKDCPPETVEGKVLHDAHLLEGDENFLITKSLVTGSARGQSLETTLGYMERQLGAHRCSFLENQKEYARREGIVRDYLNKLRCDF